MVFLLNLTSFFLHLNVSNHLFFNYNFFNNWFFHLENHFFNNVDWNLNNFLYPSFPSFLYFLFRKNSVLRWKFFLNVATFYASAENAKLCTAFLITTLDIWRFDAHLYRLILIEGKAILFCSWYINDHLIDILVFLVDVDRYRDFYNNLLLDIHRYFFDDMLFETGI